MSFKDAWQKAGEPAADFDPPDGQYTIQITEGAAFEGGDGRQWAKLDLQITAGEHEGEQFADFMNLNNDVGLRIARTNLAVYGLDADRIEDLEDLNTGMTELAGTTAEVTVKHGKNGFLNVTVFKVLTRASDIPADPLEGFQPAARYGQDPDEPIPF